MRPSHSGGFTNPKIALERLVFEKVFPNQPLPSKLVDTDDGPYNAGVIDKIKQTARDPLGRRRAAAVAAADARRARSIALRNAAEMESRAAEEAAMAIKSKAAADAAAKHKEYMERQEAETGYRWEGGHPRAIDSRVTTFRRSGLRENRF